LLNKAWREWHEIIAARRWKESFVAESKIEIALSTALIEKLIEAIQLTARTGQTADGRNFVHNIDQAIRIRTSETQVVAL
jgi:nitrogen regulatory protein P-II 2